MIIGSDVRRDIMRNYFGMGTVSVDMVALKGRIDKGLYDHEEFERAMGYMRETFTYHFGEGTRPLSNDELLATCVKMTLIVRDLMVGNRRLADSSVGTAQGFAADIELAQGANAIAAGTQGQRQWTDLYPNFDMTEALLNSSFDWGGFRPPYVVATENDSKNAIGMLAAALLTGAPQLFADIRTNWTPESIYRATGVDVADVAPLGIIDKRNSGAGALDYAVDPYAVVGLPYDTPVPKLIERLRQGEQPRRRLIEQAAAGTTWEAAILQYFPGDGLSSSYRTPGGIPMTAYRYNAVGGELTCSVVEGTTVELPKQVADHISRVTDKTWPETYWKPREMSSFEYMSRIGPNHDANSFGEIGADMATLNAMLRIPVDFHNMPKESLFRPTIWDRYGGDDYRACAKLGPLYG